MTVRLMPHPAALNSRSVKIGKPEWNSWTCYQLRRRIVTSTVPRQVHFLSYKRLTFNILREHWSGRRDSNPRPLEPHSSALPSCATARRQRSARCGAHAEYSSRKALRPPRTFDSSLALQDLLRADLIGDQSANPPAPERPQNGFGFRPAAGECDDRFLGRVS
jgi:hypothetical protein